MRGDHAKDREQRDLVEEGVDGGGRDGEHGVRVGVDVAGPAVHVLDIGVALVERGVERAGEDREELGGGVLFTGISFNIKACTCLRQRTARMGRDLPVPTRPDFTYIVRSWTGRVYNDYSETGLGPTTYCDLNLHYHEGNYVLFTIHRDVTYEILPSDDRTEVTVYFHVPGQLQGAESHVQVEYYADVFSVTLVMS